ncbi:MAG: alpha/beta hydrolase [Chitinophagales bacterium]
MKKMLYILIVPLVLYFIIMLFFYKMQESFLFHPVKTEANFKYQFPNTFEEKYFETPNNGNIHGLYFNAEKSKGIVLYWHGNAGNLEDWAWVYQNFVNLNYDVLVLDYRKFGKSTGNWSEENFINDAQYVYNELKKNYKENEIVIYGRSIGTGIATQLAANNQPKALILETPYYSIEDLAKRMLPIFPVKYLLKYRFESNLFITKVSAPIYILHGTKDNVVPYKSGKKLYNLVKQNTRFTTFEAGTHSNLATYSLYHSLLQEILA